MRLVEGAAATLALFSLHCGYAQASSSTNLCPCGYRVTSPNNTTYTFTDVLETDFTHISALNWTNPCWQPQAYNVNATAAHGLFGKSASLENIKPNPFPDSATWSGDGKLGPDPGVQLWVNKTVQDGMVRIAEMATKRNDMLYGSFRVGMKLTGIPGTCGAFFWYHSDSKEIDMEFLSSAYNQSSYPAYLVMQTPQSLAMGNDAEGTPFYFEAKLGFAPYETFHEYRFDWTPAGVDYYVDDQLLHSIPYTSSPHVGHLLLNHWSNGNMYWSRGPPPQDAAMTVAYVRAYFNSSSPSNSSCNASARQCVVPGVRDMLKGGLDMQSVRQNLFQYGQCGEMLPTVSVTSSAGHTRSSIAALALAMIVLVMM